MNRVAAHGLCALLSCLTLAPGASAQARSRASEAEKAYAEVDYERTRALASAAIRGGGNDRATSSELYLLWAIAAAALDQPDEARLAFTHALATNPELKLERNLSPKIRAPYLEARGAMAGAGGKLPLELTAARKGRELELGLRDGLHVAASLVFSGRAGATGNFTRRRFGTALSQRVPLPTGSELQYFAQVLDEHGNVLFELGSENEPRRMLQVSSERRAAASAPLGQDRNPLPYYVTAGALATLGVAAGSAATVMYLRREEAARDWNGPACEQPGMTRAQQCDDVDQRRQQAERLSIAFAASGGALLVGSVVTLLLAPSPSRPNVTLEAGARDVMLRLRTSL
jgi:hypothetical protein